MKRGHRGCWLWAVSGLVALALWGCGGGDGDGGAVEGSDEVPVVLGQPGPGDVDNRFPFDEGNLWHFQGTIQETGLPPEPFSNRAIVTGTRLVGGTTVTVLLESNPGNFGASEEFFIVEDPNGIANFGNDDPTDLFTAQLTPYWEVRFPLEAGSSFVQLDRRSLDLGEDLDGDGINERIENLRSVVTVPGFETVTVPVETYPDAAVVKNELSMTVVLSAGGTRVTATGVSTAWFVPDVGWVKRTESLAIPAVGYTLSLTEELAGFAVDGISRGSTGGL